MKSECCSADVISMKKGNQVGLYCSKCGVWIKWANKKERKLIGLGEIELREEKII